MIIALGVAIVLLSGMVGGLVGFAQSLIAMPLLLIIGVPFDTAVLLNLTIALVTRLGTAVGYRDSIDRSWQRLLLPGAAAGLLVGVAVRSLVSIHHLQIGAGVAVTLTAGLLALGPSPAGAAKPQRLVVSGLLGGLCGATVGMTGVPPALALAGTSAAAARRQFHANVAVFIAICNSVLLAGHAVAGVGFAPDWRWPSLLWLAAALLGNRIGLAWSTRMSNQLFRTVVALAAAAAGLGCVIDAASGGG